MLLLTAFTLAWALVEDVFGARLQGHYHLMQVVWCRYAAHLVLMLALCGWRTPPMWRTQRLGFHLGRSLCMLVMPLSFALALTMGDGAGTVWAVFWVSPLVVLMLARLLLGERVPAWLWGVAAVGEVVAVLMLEPSLPRTLGGLALPLLMALSFSLYVVMTRSLRQEPVQVNLFYTALGVFLPLSVLMPFVWVTPGWHDALILSAIGVFGCGALWALDRACESAPVSRSAPTLHVHLLFIAVLDWAVAGEGLSARSMLGMTLIVAMLVVLWWWQPRQASTP